MPVYLYFLTFLDILLKYPIKAVVFLLAQHVAPAIIALPIGSAVKAIAVLPMGRNVAKATPIVRPNMNVAFLIALHLGRCVARTATGVLLGTNVLSTRALATTIAVQIPIVQPMSYWTVQQSKVTPARDHISMCLRLQKHPHPRL